MTKVYQITMHDCREYDAYVQHTLGIFTDAEAAENVVSKLILDKEGKLSELYAKQDDFDKDEDRKYRDKTAFYSQYTDEYLEIDYEIRDLDSISYSIKEIIINKLYN
jgi:hypothetical protein